MRESNDVLDSDSENMEESLIVLPSNSESKNMEESTIVLPSVSDSKNMEESKIVLPSDSDSKNMGESKIVLPSDKYFETKRKLIEMNTYTRRTKEWLVYVTLAICIAMVIIGKVMYFMFCHYIYLFYKYGG